MVTLPSFMTTMLSLSFTVIAPLCVTSVNPVRISAEAFITKYENNYPKAIKCLEEWLDDSLTYYAFSRLEAKKISSTNILERPNIEIRRRTRTVGIFPNEESYTRLAAMRSIEYSEEWFVNRGGYFSPEAVRSILAANAA